MAAYDAGYKVPGDAVGYEVIASVHHFGVKCVTGVGVDDGHPLALLSASGPRGRQRPRLADAAEVKEPVFIGDGLGAESGGQRAPLHRGVLAASLGRRTGRKCQKALESARRPDAVCEVDKRVSVRLRWGDAGQAAQRRLNAEL